MAYDDALAERVRDHLSPLAEVAERRMFGGLAFLVGGSMALAVSREGGLLLRVDPGTVDELEAAGRATAAVMGGRTMTGWVRVTARQLTDDAVLGEWVDRGVAAARAQPPRPAKTRRRIDRR